MNCFKKIFMLVLLLTFLVFGITGCTKKEKNKIILGEVAHSVFYAPQYIALNNGYFKEVGLEVECINLNGADKVTASLLADEIDIGLQGPEPTIYLYKNKSKDYLINFAGLTNTDGSFIIGRKKLENFKLTDLKGLSILGGRSGGVPEMTLEYILKKAGLSINQNKEGKDVLIRTDVSFAATPAAFLAGEADAVTLFEPTASEFLSKYDNLYYYGSVGSFSGKISYTCYSVKQSYFTKNQDILEKFMKAINKGVTYLFEESESSAALALKPSFPDVSLEILESVIKRYKEIGAYKSDLTIEEDAFKRLEEIMIEAGVLDKGGYYYLVVKNLK